MPEYLEDAIALPELDRFEEFVRLISGLNKQIQKIKNLEMREFGLKGPHVMSLFYLSRHKEGLTAAQLCRLMAIDKAAVSRILTQLREQDLITYPETVHRYRVRAILTSTGSRIAFQIRLLIRDIVVQVDNGIDTAGREVMYAGLHRISDNLKTIALVSASGAAKERKNTGEQI